MSFPPGDSPGDAPNNQSNPQSFNPYDDDPIHNAFRNEGAETEYQTHLDSSGNPQSFDPSHGFDPSNVFPLAGAETGDQTNLGPFGNRQDVSESFYPTNVYLPLEAQVGYQMDPSSSGRGYGYGASGSFNTPDFSTRHTYPSTGMGAGYQSPDNSVPIPTHISSFNRGASPHTSQGGQRFGLYNPPIMNTSSPGNSSTGLTLPTQHPHPLSHPNLMSNASSAPPSPKLNTRRKLTGYEERILEANFRDMEDMEDISGKRFDIAKKMGVPYQKVHTWLNERKKKLAQEEHDSEHLLMAHFQNNPNPSMDEAKIISGVLNVEWSPTRVLIWFRAQRERSFKKRKVEVSGQTPISSSSQDESSFGRQGYKEAEESLFYPAAKYSRTSAYSSAGQDLKTLSSVPAKRKVEVFGQTPISSSSQDESSFGRQGYKEAEESLSHPAAKNARTSSYSSTGQDPNTLSSVPANPRTPTSTSDGGKRYKCTVCWKASFDLKDSWILHEKRMHGYDCGDWVCMRTSPLRLGRLCAFCGERVQPGDSAPHMKKHDALACFFEGPRSHQPIPRSHFDTKGELREHMIQGHRCDDPEVPNEWHVGPDPSQAKPGSLYCGFCGNQFTSKAKRIEHVAEHFYNSERGLGMADWTPLAEDE